MGGLIWVGGFNLGPTHVAVIPATWGISGRGFNLGPQSLKSKEILCFFCDSYMKRDPEAVPDLGGDLIWVGGFNLGREIAPTQESQKGVGVGV